MRKANRNLTRRELLKRSEKELFNQLSARRSSAASITGTFFATAHSIWCPYGLPAALPPPRSPARPC